MLSSSTSLCSKVLCQCKLTKKLDRYTIYRIFIQMFFRNKEYKKCDFVEDIILYYKMSKCCACLYVWVCKFHLKIALTIMSKFGILPFWGKRRTLG